jgi:MFS superfamily sulfate permease-like transporter
MSAPHDAMPRTAPGGFLATLRPNLTAGFLVFLIALPLCLAIAKACNFPPIAGIWTAVLGGLICTFVSNSELTIKGPAAGLIVICAGAVVDLGREFGPGLSETDQMVLGYHLALGVGLAAGLIQILFGLLRAGKLGDFFPLPAVHGMLAAIGIIIIAKQSYLVLGIDAPRDMTPLELLLRLPLFLPQLNPEIAIIGAGSLLLLAALPLVKNRYVRMIPAPMLVVVLAIPVGMYFGLDHRHTYLFPTGFFDSGNPAAYEVGPRFLVDVPEVMRNPASAFALPDLRGLLTLTGLKYVVLFALIGSLESLLSAKAIDLLDPARRKTNLNRDVLGIGLANTVSASLGGLPMISEIVRSKANIDNGAQSRWSNFFHGLFLLAFVLLLPGLIHQIPLASLGAMLVYTGFRLASPREFANTYRIGVPQLTVFVGTIVVTLVTDLLIGIAAGIALELAFHLWFGVPVRRLFRASVNVEEPDPATAVVTVRDAAIFSLWLSLQGLIYRLAETKERVTVDLSDTRLVDHSVMEKLHEMEREFHEQGKHLAVVGLEEHTPFSAHPFAARRRKVLIPATVAEPVPSNSAVED